MASKDSFVGLGGKEPPSWTISDEEAISIFLMAGLFDLLSFIFTLVAPVIAIIGQVVMTIIWFSKGINPWGKKYWVWYLVTWIMEFIPFVSGLPMFSFATFRFIAISRVEDKLRYMTKLEHLDNEKTKAMARRVLENKTIKDRIASAEKRAIERAPQEQAMKDKMHNKKTSQSPEESRSAKAKSIGEKRGALDNSLKADPNSGVSRASFVRKDKRRGSRERWAQEDAAKEASQNQSGEPETEAENESDPAR